MLLSNTRLKDRQSKFQIFSLVPNTPRQILILANQGSETITVIPADDSVDEDSFESVIITLVTDNSIYGLGAPNSATVVIVDNDNVPVDPEVGVFVTDSFGDEEGEESAQFRVILSQSQLIPIDINYTLTGTASGGLDYQSLSGTITIQASETFSNLDILPIDDNLFEGSETVTITLQSGTGYAVGPIDTGSLIISDNESVPETLSVTLSVVDPSAAEANLDPAQFSLSISPTPPINVEVSFEISGSAVNGEDYEAINTSVIFPMNQSDAQLVTIVPIANPGVEPEENVVITLVDSSAYDIDGSPQCLYYYIAG